MVFSIFPSIPALQNTIAIVFTDQWALPLRTVLHLEYLVIRKGEILKHYHQGLGIEGNIKDPSYMGFCLAKSQLVSYLTTLISDQNTELVLTKQLNDGLLEPLLGVAEQDPDSLLQLAAILKCNKIDWPNNFDFVRYEGMKSILRSILLHTRMVSLETGWEA